MDRRKGFTLIELLVVIAIIALLMSILMPALARVRKQAKNAICMSNLKQWGAIFAMYTNNHDGYFMGGWYSNPDCQDCHRESWPYSLRSYVDIREKGLACCPMAGWNNLTRKGTSEMPGSTFIPWGGPSPIFAFLGGEIGDCSSYGTNSYIYNRPLTSAGEFKPEHWRRIDVKGAGNIPMFLDCIWVTAGPSSIDDPPDFDGAKVWSGATGGLMGYFCVNRHNRMINGLFMDGTVRNIRLKQLWKLKWSRDFDISAPEPDWASVGTGWMANFPD